MISVKGPSLEVIEECFRQVMADKVDELRARLTKRFAEEFQKGLDAITVETAMDVQHEVERHFPHVTVDVAVHLRGGE